MRERGPRSHETSPTDHLSYLEGLLNDYSDEIPEERVTGRRTHKVNAAWFQDTFGALRTAIADELGGDAELVRDVEAHLTRVRARRLDAREAMRRGEAKDGFVKTTREEIDAANDLLRRTIAKLRENRASQTKKTPDGA